MRVKISKAVNTELEVYKALQGEDITPQILAIVNNEGKRVGFVSPDLKHEGARVMNPADEEDRDACLEVLNEMHKKGWVHEDPHSDNFLILDRGILSRKVYVIDFETAQRATPSLIEDDVDKFQFFWEQRAYG
ncbi:Uu.00g128840.m01.CDS01 [Anthostomella pinea]|uniref:Uu.00g128840.m01.CDS01 n=1 Tax=Anthostomella pinea TaxID=933095 RepID=A0AAI8YHX3_9PEZI|nr:Uu.00g128840.m01.CDS01 [Anthostomella pinea]